MYVASHKVWPVSIQRFLRKLELTDGPTIVIGEGRRKRSGGLRRDQPGR